MWPSAQGGQPDASPGLPSTPHLGPLAGNRILPDSPAILGLTVSSAQCIYAPGYIPQSHVFEDFKDRSQRSSTDRRKQSMKCV